MFLCWGTLEQRPEGSEGMNSRCKGPGSGSALGLFKDEQGGLGGWSSVNGQESEGDETLKVTGKGLQIMRAWQARVRTLFPQVIRGTAAGVRQTSHVI